MSRAVELATKCGIFPDSAMGLRIFNEHELEAFYHAARAEALREAESEIIAYAAQLAMGSYHDWPDALAALNEVREELRAMADREGK